jgi:hypothetical protein
MAVYVDDHRCPEVPGGWASGWSHLFADTRTELEAFAIRLGLSRDVVSVGVSGVHVRVPDGVRARALGLGAVPLHVGSPGWRSVVRRARAQAALVLAGVAA